MSAPDAERLRIVAHELRSPVAALEALTSAAAASDDPALVRQLVALGIAAAHDVERIVSDPELVSLHLEPVDVAGLAAAFRAPTVTVETSGAALVSGDATRLRQLLSNLVANALRHGTHAAVEVSVDGDAVLVSVTDDGPGVVPGLDPFARGASGAGSTGYGLWLARAIAEAHGGTLEVVDAPGPGVGASLRLVLPSSSP